MSSNRIRILFVSLLAMFGALTMSAVGAASASATCLQVAVPGTGHWEKSTCIAPVGTTKEYVEVEKLETYLGAGVWCAKVKAGEPSTYKDNKCTEPEVGTGKYTKVLESGDVWEVCEEKAGEGKEPPPKIR